MTPTMIKLLLYFLVWDLIVNLYDLKNKGLYTGVWGNIILISKAIVSLCFILVIIFQLQYLG